MAEADLGRHKLVRLAEREWTMLISRDLAQALLDNDGVGFGFEAPARL
jgi:hypothetical protein